MSSRCNKLKPEAKENWLEHKAPVCIWLKCLVAGVSVLTGLTVMAATAPSLTGSVTLAWNPSPDANVGGYNLYYGGANGVYTNKISTTNVTNVVVSGLVVGATYYFAATVYDTAGLESPFSTQATYLVPANTSGQPPVLESPSFSSGRFSFTVPGVAGSQSAVEASVNLVTWVRVATNTVPFTFVETNAGQFGKRFFRTVSLP